MVLAKKQSSPLPTKGLAFADIDEEGALAAAKESKNTAKDASFKVISVKVYST